MNLDWLRKLSIEAVARHLLPGLRKEGFLARTRYIALEAWCIAAALPNGQMDAIVQTDFHRTRRYHVPFTERRQ
jgi:hypothetical protein